MSGRAIVILGMHRSGTSAFAGALSLLGINFGHHLLPPAFDNERGFFENVKIFNVNEAILSSLHSSWDDLLALPQEWWRESSLEVYKRRIRNVIREEFGHGEIFAMKDPRLSLLFPLWREILDDLDIAYDFILPVRNPLEVAMSLAKRNKFSLGKGVLLWMNYNLEAEKHSRECSRIILSYDKLLEFPIEVLEYIAKKMEINYPAAMETAIIAAGNFIDPELKHHDFMQNREDKRLYNPALKLYDSLMNLSVASNETSNAAAVVDHLAAEFTDMRNFFFPLELQNDLRKILTVKRRLKAVNQRIEQTKQKVYHIKKSWSGQITLPSRSIKSYFRKIKR